LRSRKPLPQQLCLQAIQKRMLRFLHFLSRAGHRKESGPVNLRKAFDLSGPRRPFEFKRVALQRTGFVPVAGKRPGVNYLSALLLDRAQLDEITMRLEPGLLLKLAHGGREQFFVRFNLALRNAPVSLIFVVKQRPAGMRQKNLELPFSHPIHQQPGADFVLCGHACAVFLLPAPAGVNKFAFNLKNRSVVMNITTMLFVAPNLACGKERGGSLSRSGSVTDEQRSHRPNSAQPFGRQFFFSQTSLLAPHSGSTSRLVWPKNSSPRTSSL